MCQVTKCFSKNKKTHYKSRLMERPEPLKKQKENYEVAGDYAN